MQSVHLPLEPDPTPHPHTVWRSPPGLPRFTPPTLMGLLRSRGQRVFYRWRRWVDKRRYPGNPSEHHGY